MKSLPNFITVSRIFLSFLLLFLPPFGRAFWCVYFACGASDAIDGFLARTFKLESEKGAILDSIADIAFVLLFLWIFLQKALLPPKILFFILIIAAIKILSVIIFYCKEHSFFMLHTYLNKAAGLSLFFFPYFYIATEGIGEIALAVTLVVCTIAASEELLIALFSKKASRDQKGLFIR